MHKSIIYPSIGLILGLIIGWLFTESMHFYNLGFAILYFGTIFALIIYGLLSSIDYFIKKNKKIFCNLAIFVSASLDIVLIFINFKGYAAFFLNNIDLLAIWLINISIIIFFGLVGSFLDKIKYKKNKFSIK